MAFHHHRAADVHEIPTGRIVAVEHPGIVRNFDNGLKSLGGEAQLKNVLEHHVGDSKLSSKQNQLPEPVAGVSLRPNDPLAKRIPSVGVESRNVLVKVTLPKRTGRKRKRKRGSDEPYTEAPELRKYDNSITAPDLLRRLRDNESNYTIKPVAMLRETHRFRTLPDFQLRNADLPIMRELRDHALIPDYNRLKDFRIDLTPGSNGITAFPGPPSFTNIDIPYKYEYQQAATVVTQRDETGRLVFKNVAAPAKRITWGLAPDVAEIPQRPPDNIPIKNPDGTMLPNAIKELKKLLDQRPLVTKRVALNSMKPISDTIFKEATQYVGYSFKAGPWRDSLIKYGVDPRKDPKYRFYQTLMFQVDSVAFKGNSTSKGGAETNGTPSKAPSNLWARTLRHMKADPSTHIFDGKNITANGKTWQICDVSDPIVHDIFHTENIRTECDVYQWGWFQNGTIAKGRAIMKDKMRFLFAGETPPEEEYKPVVEKIPEIITKENIHLKAVLNRNADGERAAQLSMEVRNMIKTGDGSRNSRDRWQKKRRGEEVDGEDTTMGEADDQAEEDVDLREIDVGDDGDEDEDEEQGDFGDMDEQDEEEEDDEGNAEGGELGNDGDDEDEGGG